MLGAFAIVKFVVLVDKPAATAAVAATTAVGSIEIALADDGVAEVYLNDQKRGDATSGKLALGALAPGSYQVKIARAGAIACAETIEVVAGQARQIRCELKPEPVAAVVVDAGPPETLDAAAAAEAVDAAAAPIDAAPVVATGSGSGTGSAAGSGSGAIATVVGKRPGDKRGEGEAGVAIDAVHAQGAADLRFVGHQHGGADRVVDSRKHADEAQAGA